MVRQIKRRNTIQKKIILEELAKVRTHPDAKTLFRLVRRRLLQVSFGTVYRNLNLLRDEGSILELNLGRYSCHYDADTHDHHHFLCLNCRKIFDLSCTITSGLERRLNKQGFDLQYQRIHLYGYCPKCKNKAKRR